MTPDNGLIQLLVQSGFAGLFVWLLIDTRREAAKREGELIELANKLNQTIGTELKTVAQLIQDHDKWERTLTITPIRPPSDLDK